MNTQNATANSIEPKSLRPSVGQLAKSHFPTLKTTTNKSLAVGRQANKNPRTQASVHTPDLVVRLTESKQDISAMTYLNRLLKNMLPELKVCFHNALYVQQIQENYSLTESSFLLQWVKTFALIRRSDRVELMQDVVLTNEQDFLTAFRLMQQRKIAEYSDVNPKSKSKVLDLLRYKFQYRTFSAQILAQELFYNYKPLNKIIMLLLLEKEIEFVKEMSGQKTFRLREKYTVLC